MLQIWRFSSVACFVSLMGAWCASTWAEEPQFQSIFDGKSLTHWDGDPDFWRVEDGTITGQSTAEKPTKGNTFIIWRGGEVADFELKLEYKIVGGNSGIQYRSFQVPATEEPHTKWVIGGYQADFEAGDTYSGILYGERFRGILGERGQRTVIGADHKPTVVGTLGDAQEIGKAILKEQWNTYHITAQGFHFVHKINGVTTVDVTDEDQAERRAQGLLALQLHAGPPMKVQFRNIQIKHLPAATEQQQSWIDYPAKSGPGNGKKVVLVAGDHEYRSEEALPQLGKILSQHHGFPCRVVFPIDPATGEINPSAPNNLPGLEALEEADLMVIFTRFCDLPESQMQHIVNYVMAGKPVVGLRTATHAFQTSREAFRKWNYNSQGEPGFEDGFGRVVLGETWVNHHGHHGSESTRGIPAPGQAGHPILRGVDEVWGPTDVYTVRLPLPERCQALLLGQVLQGMRPQDSPLVGSKNEPMMPIAWIQQYQCPAGKPGRAFTTTMGSSQDLENAGFRRLLVNACYWGVGLEDQIDGQRCVDIVGKYAPTPFAFGKHQLHVRPADHRL